MSSKKTFLAGLFGNTLEWYDFILYANFAPLIASLFFPAKNPLISLLITFAVFATGFLARPFGAILFGTIGDHLGRRKALIISMCVMSIPTCLIGILPTYATVGMLAPILLTLLRIVQGIAVSGELNSATTYLIEHVAPMRRGFAGSLVMCTAFVGILTGAAIATATTFSLSQTQLHNWGWRVPFLLGGILGIIGIFIRMQSKESPKFLEKKETVKVSSLRQIFCHYPKELILTIFVTCIMAVGNYVIIAYVVTMLDKLEGFSLQDANTINLISMLFFVILIPIMGSLSDSIGRKPVFKMGLIGSIILSLPIFWLLTQHHFGLALLGDLLLCLTLAPIAGLIPTLIAELFPTHVRNTGTTLGYNIALAIFGGTLPLVALGLVNMTNNHLAPAFYIILCAIISSIALAFIKESHKKTLD